MGEVQGGRQKLGNLDTTSSRRNSHAVKVVLGQISCLGQLNSCLRHFVLG